MSSKIKLNKKTYVANLRFETGEPDPKGLFSNAGDVMSVNIVKDRQTGQTRGFAFVEMSTQWEARRAVSMLNRKDFICCSIMLRHPGEGNYARKIVRSV